MGKLSSGSLSFFLKLQCAPGREERSHVTSDFLNFFFFFGIFYFAKFCSICVYSAINGHSCKIKRKRKPGHKKALLVMLRVLERPIFAMNQSNRDTCPM
jgi:hypothetical protein